MTTPSNLSDKLAAFKIKLEDLDRLVAVQQAIAAAANPDPELGIEILVRSGKATPSNVAKALESDVRAQVDAQPRQRSAAIAIEALGKQASAVVRSNAETILETIRPEFDKVARELQQTTVLVGAKPDKAILNVPGAGTATDRQRELVPQLTALNGIRVLLGGTRSPAWYLETIPNVDAYEKAEQAFLRDGPLGLIAAGIAVRLNSNAEAEALLDGATAATDQAAADRLANDPARAARIRDGRRLVEAHQKLMPKK
ncbi:hypothetical protein BH23ACT4_BH23ACT4_03620 [soil metagenome]